MEKFKKYLSSCFDPAITIGIGFSSLNVGEKAQMPHNPICDKLTIKTVTLAVLGAEYELSKKNHCYRQAQNV